MSFEPTEKQLSAQILYATATKMPRPHKLVDFPRKDPSTGLPLAQIPMVLLTQKETRAAAAEATLKAQKLLRDESGKPPSIEEVQKSEVYLLTSTNELLFRCCKDPDDPSMHKPLFKKPEEIEEWLTTDEMSVLAMNYNTFRIQMSPIQSPLDSEEELEHFLATLAYGGNFDPLASASQALLIQCVTYLVVRLYASQTSKSSPGLRPGSGESLKPSEPSLELSV